MKKFFSIFFTIILLVVIAAGVYLFAFDKEVPLSLVEDKVKEIDPQALKIASFDEANEINNFTCNCVMDVRSSSVNSRVSITIKKSGKDDKFVLDIDSTMYKYLQGEFYEDTTSNASYYIQNSKYMYREKGELTEMTESLWKLGVLTSLYIATPYTATGLPYGELISDNLDKVTQKSIYFTAFASKDNVSVELKTNVFTQSLKSYTITSVTYTASNEIDTTTTISYTFK